jgi:hypothetical protein
MIDDARYRVDWYPGSDHLLGVCHCGATRVAEDPIEIWQWLLGHPVAHEVAGDGAEPRRVLVETGR